MKKMMVPFASFWVLNSVMLYVATILYPIYFRLGTGRISFLIAGILAGFVWTVLTWFSDPPIRQYLKIKNTGLMFLFHFATNFVSLWIVARLAPYTGFGTTKFVWIAFLALIADIAQFALWKMGKFKM